MLEVGSFASSRTQARIIPVEYSERLAWSGERVGSLNASRRMQVICDDLKICLAHIQSVILCVIRLILRDPRLTLNEIPSGQDTKYTNLDEIAEVLRVLNGGRLAMVHRPDLITMSKPYSATQAPEVPNVRRRCQYALNRSYQGWIDQWL